MLCFGWRDTRIELLAHGSDGEYRIEIGGTRLAITQARLADGILSVEIDGRAQRFRCRADHLGDAELGGGGDRVLAPMPGRIVLLRVTAGDAVAEGQELGVMEAMKMELALKAPRAGVVAEVRVAAGDFVDGDAVLIRLEA